MKPTIADIYRSMKLNQISDCHYGLFTKAMTIYVTDPVTSRLGVSCDAVDILPWDEYPNKLHNRMGEITAKTQAHIVVQQKELY